MNFVRYLQCIVIAVMIVGSQSPLFSQQVQVQGDVYCENKVKYPKSNEEYPATMIKNINGNYIPLIYWVHEVAGEKPEKRCEEVSKIIRARFDSKTWNKRYFRTGKTQEGYPIICFVGEKEQSCNETNKILKLDKKEKDAAKILDEMFALKRRTDLKLTGEVRSYCDEVSEDICYNIDKFLEKITSY